MKKLYALLPMLIIPFTMIFLANSSGSPGGLTGSPGDGGATCTGCHSGTPQNASGWITSDVPGNGYVGGETYELTLSGTHAGAQRFGFELTAENATGEKLGGFTITNSTETKLVNSNNAVTHTSQGTSASGGSKSWTFQWTAPEGSTGDITFYASVNAANGDGGTGGDVIYLTNKEITPDVTGIAEAGNALRIYPNPASGIVNVEAPQLAPGSEVVVYNIGGQRVHTFVVNNLITQINLTHLNAGVYFMQAGENAAMQKLVLR